MRSRWCGGLRVHAWLSPWIITSRCGIRIMPDCLLLSGCLFLFLDMLQDLRLGFHRPQMIPTFLLLDLSWSNPSLCHWQKILFPEKILCVCGTQRNRHRERETTKPCAHYHDKRGDEQVRNGGEKNDERKGTVKAASCWRDHPLPVSLQGGSQKIFFFPTQAIDIHRACSNLTNPIFWNVSSLFQDAFVWIKKLLLQLEQAISPFSIGSPLLPVSSRETLNFIPLSNKTCPFFFAKSQQQPKWNQQAFPFYPPLKTALSVMPVSYELWLGGMLLPLCVQMMTEVEEL